MIPHSGDTIATWEEPDGRHHLLVRLDAESLAALRGEAPLPDTPVVLDDRGVAMTRAPDGTWHYVVRVDEAA